MTANGENQRVTNAVLNQKLDNLIERINEYHNADVKWRDLIDQRMRILETFKDSATVQIVNLQKESEDVCKDVNKLKDRVNIWGSINSIAAGVATYLGIKL